MALVYITDTVSDMQISEKSAMSELSILFDYYSLSKC